MRRDKPAARCLNLLLFQGCLQNTNWREFSPAACLLVLSGPGEEMGAKASLVQGPGPSAALFPSPTLENIQAAYEDKQEEVARELIQQACCAECSAGMPCFDGVRIKSSLNVKLLLSASLVTPCCPGWMLCTASVFVYCSPLFPVTVSSSSSEGATSTTGCSLVTLVSSLKLACL